MSRSGLLALALLTAACGSGESGGARTGPEPRVYEVRGVVRQLPAADGGQILLFHEAIPDFVDIRGETAPMEAMTMPFDLADGLDLSGLAPGDKVKVRLDVDWGRTPPALVTRVEKLPAETELELGG